MRQLTRKAEVGVLRACEEAALRRSIFDMLQHMKRGCTRSSWTCFLSESDLSGITVFVGHKGDEDKGSWHVHVCVKMKSISTMTAKINTCNFFSAYVVSTYCSYSRSGGTELPSPPPCRTFLFRFSRKKELIATFFSRWFSCK